MRPPLAPQSDALGEGTASGRWSDWLLRSRWVGVVAIIAALVVLVALPGRKTASGKQVDFPCYYSAARLMVKRQDPGDWALSKAEARTHGFRLAGPVCVPAFPMVAVSAPMALFRPEVAKWIWLGIGVLCLAAGAAITLAASRHLTVARFGLAFLLSTVFVPALYSLYLGQISHLMIPFVALAYFAYVRKRPVVAGFAVAMAAAVKPAPLLLVAHFVFRRQWRSLAAVAVTGLVGLLLSMAWVGPDYLSLWWKDVCYFERDPAGSMASLLPHGQSLSAATARVTRVGIPSWGDAIAPPLVPQVPGWALLTIAFVALSGCSLLAGLRLARSEVTPALASVEFAMSLALGFMLFPLSQDHHASGMVVALIACLLVAVLTQGRRLRWAVGASIVLLIVTAIGQPTLIYMESPENAEALRRMGQRFTTVPLFVMSSVHLLAIGVYWFGNMLEGLLWRRSAGAD